MTYTHTGAGRYPAFDQLTGRIPACAGMVFDKNCLGKVVRGAEWDAIPFRVRLVFRSGGEPDTRRSYIGFRLAVDLTH